MTCESFEDDPVPQKPEKQEQPKVVVEENASQQKKQVNQPDQLVIFSLPLVIVIGFCLSCVIALVILGKALVAETAKTQTPKSQDQAKNVSLETKKADVIIPRKDLAIQELKEKIDSLAKVNENLAKEVSELKIDRVKDQIIQQLQEEAAVAKKNLKDEEAKNVLINQQVNDLQKQLAGIKSELEAEKSEIDNLTKDKASLTAKVESLKNTLASQNNVPKQEKSQEVKTVEVSKKQSTPVPQVSSQPKPNNAPSNNDNPDRTLEVIKAVIGLTMVIGLLLWMFLSVLHIEV